MTESLSGDDVVRTAIAFLDQFIARGAQRDVRDVRQRLDSDPRTVAELLGRLRTPNPDAWEAFVAFRAFLSAQAQRFNAGHGPVPNLNELLDWMEPWDHNQDPDVRATADPAQWHDWLLITKAER